MDKSFYLPNKSWLNKSQPHFLSIIQDLSGILSNKSNSKLFTLRIFAFQLSKKTKLVITKQI